MKIFLTGPRTEPLRTDGHLFLFWFVCSRFIFCSSGEILSENEDHQKKAPRRRTKIGKKRKVVEPEESNDEKRKRVFASEEAEEMDDEEIIEEEIEAEELDAGEQGDFPDDIDKRKDDSETEEIEEIDNP